LCLFSTARREVLVPHVCPDHYFHGVSFSAICGISCIIRDFAIIISSSKDSTGKRGPYSGSVFSLLEDSSVLLFELVPLDHVILNLVANWLVEIELLADQDGLHNSLWVPLRGSPVVHLTLVDKGVHGSARFLNWGFIVWSVAEVYIYIVSLESLKRVVDAFHDVLS
jgi:hypothetical protein